MPQPSFRSAGTAYIPGANGTTAVIPAPANTIFGDVILVHLYLETTSAITSVDTAFQEITTPSPPAATGTSAFTQRTFWKRSSGDEPASYTFDWTTAAWRDGVATAWADCIASGTPFDLPVVAARSTNGTVTPAVSTTPAGNNRRLVWVGGNFNGGAWTPPSGYTEHVDGGVTLAVSVASVGQTTAAATGSVTGTSASSGTETAWLIPLIPNAEPGRMLMTA